MFSIHTKVTNPLAVLDYVDDFDSVKSVSQCTDNDEWFIEFNKVAIADIVAAIISIMDDVQFDFVIVRYNAISITATVKPPETSTDAFLNELLTYSVPSKVKNTIISEVYNFEIEMKYATDIVYTNALHKMIDTVATNYYVGMRQKTVIICSLDTTHLDHADFLLDHFKILVE